MMSMLRLDKREKPAVAPGGKRLMRRSGGYEMMPSKIVRLACAALLAAPLTGVTSLAWAQDAPVIALSNSFYGNTWRRQMVDAFTEQAEAAKAEGLIPDSLGL